MINCNFIGIFKESYNKPLDFLKFIMVKINTDFANAVHVILLKTLIANNRFYYVIFLCSKTWGDTVWYSHID